eukprot:4191773-Pleurochrysis_carterae.AAC.1
MSGGVKGSRNRVRGGVTTRARCGPVQTHGLAVCLAPVQCANALTARARARRAHGQGSGDAGTTQRGETAVRRM